MMWVSPDLPYRDNWTVGAYKTALPAVRSPPGLGDMAGIRDGM